MSPIFNRADQPSLDLRRDVGGFRFALTWSPQHFPIAVAGVPIPRDLVRDVVGIETAEYSGDKKRSSLARSIEIAEHAPANGGHVIDPGMKQRMVGP